ncbi:ATP-dependent DNA ligase [Candidatus Woesearchaeota archaeon]|nr:ATP-dependent DNA ligase [Candidatus Woesearchaeota archaeon]
MKPMLAKLWHDKPFTKKGWISERKLDGERCIASINKKVRLHSRNEKNITKKYPEIAQALERTNIRNCILDGEIVAFDGSLTSFATLQPRVQVKNPSEQLKKNVPVYYYIFDITKKDGKQLEHKKLSTRKQQLKALIDYKDPLRYVTHRLDGKKYFHHACKKGWEGIIAKKGSSTYEHKRSSNWLKFKCISQQEFVICGYTDPKGERQGFGALLLGYYDDDTLKYAGKVGTGFSDEFLTSFSKKLQNIERKTSPFDEDIKEHAHWVSPHYVGEIAFTEWTDDKRLRHPRFKGLRTDKKAKEVVRE